MKARVYCKQACHELETIKEDKKPAQSWKLQRGVHGEPACQELETISGKNRNPGVGNYKWGERGYIVNEPAKTWKLPTHAWHRPASIKSPEVRFYDAGPFFFQHLVDSKRTKTENS